MTNTTYGVWGADERMNNDYADWRDTCEEALEAARELAAEEGSAYVMKFVDDECAWNWGIEVDKDGGAWSEDWEAREEMGFVQ